MQLAKQAVAPANDRNSSPTTMVEAELAEVSDSRGLTVEVPFADRHATHRDHAAVNRVVFRQGRIPAAPERPKRPDLRPVPKELGQGLREIADPELRACLESLGAQIAATSGPPSLGPTDDAPLPETHSEQSNR